MTGSGLYLQVYPSNLASASRMEKIGISIQSALEFDGTHLVGMRSDPLPHLEEATAGVRIVRLGPAKTPSRLGRVGRVLWWHVSVLRTYARKPVAIVAAHKVWTLPLCRLLARLNGAALVYNCHELETEAHGMVGLRKRFAKLIESRNIGACRVVSVVNQPIADWYEAEYGVRPVVVGNLPVRPATEVDPVDLRTYLGVPDDRLLFVHTGHLIEARNIPLILEVFAASVHHVVFLGEGHPKEPRVKDLVLAAAEGHTNIHWLPPVPHELIVDTIRSADVGLCMIEGHLDLSDHLSSPNKLFEYLAAGIPPLCSDLPVAQAELGPLAQTWIVQNPERDLAAAVGRLTPVDIDAFRQSWRGLGTWNEEIADLVAAYRALF